MAAIWTVTRCDWSKGGQAQFGFTAMNHVLRPPHVELSSILTQQNPSIDLRVHDYENSTRNFLKALTTYKNRAITNISERRKHQAMERKKLLERTQAVEMETNQCKLKEIELVARTLCWLPLCYAMSS